MRWGEGWGLPWGNPATWAIILAANDFRSGIAVTFLAVFSQYYQLVVDGRICGSPIYVAAGSTKEVSGNYTFPAAPHTYSIEGVGPWPKPGLFDVTASQVFFLSTRSERIHLEIAAAPAQFSEGDFGQFSNWLVNGVKRFTNCRPVDNRLTWGELDVRLSTDVNGLHALTLSLGGTRVAQGSRIGDGVLTLTEANGSGVAASGVNEVTLAYSRDLDVRSAAVLETAFPAQYFIYYRKDTPWTSFGTPTAIKYDDGKSSGMSFDSPPLPTGLYQVVVHQVDEDGNESGSTVNQTVQIVHVPGAPGVPVYVTGGAADDSMNVINITSDTTLSAAQSGATITTTGATGPITITLCSGVQNLNFEFENTSGVLLTIQRAGTDQIFELGWPIGGGSHIYSNEMNANLILKCTRNEIWTVFYEPQGTWTVG